MSDSGRKKLILICGPKGSGKSSFAEDLCLVLRNANIVGLADSLKNACAKAFKLDRWAMDDPIKKEEELPDVVVLSRENLEVLFRYFGVTDEVLSENYAKLIRPHINKVFLRLRELLQYCGTEVLQGLDKTLMANRAIQDFEDKEWNIIPDIRFWHEINLFCNSIEFEYYLYYIHSHKAELVANQARHISEREYREFKYMAQIIDNNGDRMSLQMQARKIAKSLLEKPIT